MIFKTPLVTFGIIACALQSFALTTDHFVTEQPGTGSFCLFANARVADILADTENLPGFLADQGITVLDTVPTLASMLQKDVPSVRLLIFGGEVLPDSLLQRWTRQGRQIFNTYGPTETTIVATVAEQCGEQPIAIGRPLPNYTCYVVDHDLKQVPRGNWVNFLLAGPALQPVI